MDCEKNYSSHDFVPVVEVANTISLKHAVVLAFENTLKTNKVTSDLTQLLAPTGAQEMLMFVRSVQTCLEQSIFIFLGQRSIRAVREREDSESNQSIQIKVIQSEPKILRLV